MAHTDTDMQETPRMDRRAQRHQSRTGSTYAAFIKDLRQAGNLDRHLAECAAVSVVGALIRRIQPTEARDLEAQLPRRLVEFLPRPETARGPRRFGRLELLQTVAEDLGVDVTRVEPIIRAVFTTLRNHISEGEAEDVEHNLPADLQALWRLTQ